MNTVCESFISVCVVLAAVELASRFCSQNEMVRFVRALVVLVLFVSVLSGACSLELDLFQPDPQKAGAGEELSGYVSEQVEAAAQREGENWLQGLLATAGLKAEKIALETDINEDGSIVLKKVSAVFAYESDTQRALALLRNTLGDGTKVEVQTNGR